MQYKGKAIKEIQVIDTTNNNEVIVSITDCKIEATNGYKVVAIPCTHQGTNEDS